MKIRAVQFAPALGDVERNLEFHLREIDRARRESVELIVFPELSLSGYHLKDIVYDISLTPQHAAFKEISRLSREIDVILGAPWEEPRGIIYNAGLCFSKGELSHRHLKVQLPTHGMFEERMIFKPGGEFRPFALSGHTAGMLVCREILFPIYAYLYYLQHTDLLIGISNSPQRNMAAGGFASLELWESMGYVYSQFFHQNYLFVNRVGFEEGIGFPGGSFFARAGAGIVQKAKYHDPDFLDCEADPADVRRARVSANYLRDEEPHVVLRELRRILHA